MGVVCASELDNETYYELTLNNDSQSVFGVENEGIGEEITVDTWDDLQYYCSQNDKNYVLKLKENTNYYPTNPKDEDCQIKVNNNVTIIGSSGAYFGDSSQNARDISYLAMNVPENSGIGITLKGVTFKWISSNFQPDAVFLLMAGNARNVIENCSFANSSFNGGHSSVIHLVRGSAVLANCTFKNITTDYGCISIYDPEDDSTKTCTGAHMEVEDSYFEGNYARTEPGCINNCGVLVVRNSTFYKNTAFWWAGAIHTHGGANTTIYDSNFTDNSAGWNGGALYTYSYLQIYNTVFVGNNCTTNNGGGAIGACKYLHSPYIYIKDSLFDGNNNLCWSLTDESTAGTGRGGAISIMDEGSLTVLNTTFIKNSASVGTAICAITQGSLYGSPNVTIIGNRFINHTRLGDAIVLKLSHDSFCEIADNYYFNNSIEFSKLKLIADDPVGGNVTLHIDASLKNPKYYDSDILKDSGYDVYVDGSYYMTVVGTDFEMNLKNLEKCHVYVVPSISNSKSNEVLVGVHREYIYVSQKYGDDRNNGSSRQSPVASITKAVELARSYGNILIMDGNFSDSNIDIDYNVTIVGEDNAVISAKGSLFNIVDVDVSFKNLIFENIVKSSSNDRIIKQSGGILEIKNCTFRCNSLNVLIENNGCTEASDLKFIDNNGVLISSNNYNIDSCLFEANHANDSININALIKSDKGLNSKIFNSSFINNVVKEGCVCYNGASQNTLSILNCEFIKNTAKYSQSAQTFSSGVYVGGGFADIKNSLFLNNTDTGIYSSVVYTSVEVHVCDSVFLGNSLENSNSVIINSKASSNLKKIFCDNNWWGNTAENMTKAPQIHASSNCNSWLFLNATINATALTKNQKALIQFDLNHVMNSDGSISYYDAGAFDFINFNIKSIGGQSSEDIVKLYNGIASVVYTLTDYSGEFISSYNDVNVIFNFTKTRINPEMIISVDDVNVGESIIVNVELPSEITGNLTISMGNFTQAKEITSSKTMFELDNLDAGEYTVNIYYSGDEHYDFASKEAIFNVNKYNSTTEISVVDMKVGEDVVVTVKVCDGATGSIILNVNGINRTLNLVGSQATYTLNSVSRGDYKISAAYSGDLKYLPSWDEISFGIDKQNSTIAVNVENIVYGQVAIIEVILNSNATGNVSVSVDNKNKTAKIENGKVKFNISDLSAGTKDVHVTYGGDNEYNSKECSATFNVDKSSTSVFVNADDIKIGSDAGISVSVLNGVTGNVTIICNGENVTKTINRLGQVSWTISNLPVGQYDVSVIFNSDNYETVENSTAFSVSDYPIPQWQNEGYNAQNNGKSQYESDSNGKIVWSYNLNGNVLANIAIDSEGNIYIITSSGIFSIDDNGNQHWNYNFTNNGNFSGIAIGRDVVISPETGNTIHFINQTTGLKFGHSNIYLASSLFAPIVDSNANVYVVSEKQVASNDYKLVIIPYKLWENGGNPKLISLGNSKPIAAPTIVNEKYAIVACDNGIKIVDLIQDRVESNSLANQITARPVAGLGNIIYAVVDNSIEAMTVTGDVIWKTSISGGAGNYMVLDDENGVYLTNLQGNLYKYDLIDGKEYLISNLNYTSGILLGNDGTIYIGLNDALYALDGEGNVLFKSALGENIVGTPVMGSNGRIYLTTVNSLKSLGFEDLKESNLDVEVKDINYGENATFIISIDEDATGVLSIEIGSKSYVQPVNKSNMSISVSNLSIGKTTAKIIFSGDKRFKSKDAAIEFKVMGNSEIVIGQENSYCGNQFSATLKDVQGNAVPSQKINLEIGSNKYELVTDANGNISVDLDSIPGEYPVRIAFYGNDYLKATSKSSKLTVLSTIQSNDMTRGYNSGMDFNATFLTSSGQVLSNASVLFVVNGVTYNVTTDLKGVATLNNKFAVGDYVVEVINPVTGENKTQTTKIVKRIIGNSALTMDYLDGSLFKVRIIGDDGKAAGSGEIVKFNVNGKVYTAKTDKNGYAKYKFTLTPKTYKITTEYKGYKVSNKLVVKQVLKAKNVSKKKAKYYKFNAYLKTSKGKAIAGKKIIFKIKGKTFAAKTNKKGVATITIKLKLKVGKYTIISKYSKTTIKNILTIKK
ncbi:Ig-like domain repeat protein [Methanobrevibacter sp.]